MSDVVEGAFQAADIPGHNMGVDLCRFDIGVTEQVLENADINTVFQHMGGEAMTQGMTANLFCPERIRMGLASKVADIAQDPLAIGLLRTICIVVVSQDFPHLVHQLEFGILAELRFIFHIAYFNILISGILQVVL